jgi:hypothetical protein
LVAVPLRFLVSHVPAWFWGHEQNLNIFQDDYRPSDWPIDPDITDLFRPLPKGRCIGHSAIPVEDEEDPYAKHYLLPLKSEQLRLGLTNV